MKDRCQIDIKLFLFFYYLHSLEWLFMLLALNQIRSGARATATIQAMTQSPYLLKENTLK